MSTYRKFSDSNSSERSYNRHQEYHYPGPPAYSVAAAAPPRGVLPYPVVIPQRRPGNKERGFMLAYVPCLEEFGIDQSMLLEFIRTCNNAIQLSPVMGAVKLAAFGAGFSPTPIISGVATVVSFGATAVGNATTNSKMDNFIANANQQLFQPRGLFCMVTSYNPDQQSNFENRFNRSSHNGLRSMLQGDSFRSNRESAGGFPAAVAPMVFIDEPDEGQGGGDQQLGSKVRQGFGRFNTYLDQRVQTKYVRDNLFELIVSLTYQSHKTIGNRDVLSSQPGPTTSNKMQRELDKARMEHDREVEKIYRDNKSRDKTQKKLAKVDEEYQKNIRDISKKMGEGGGGQKINKNTLYLTIVNMPSMSELDAARNGLSSGEAVAMRV